MEKNALLLKKLCELKTPQLYHVMVKYFEKFYKKSKIHVDKKQNFIYVEGDVNIGLVAHIDTVFGTRIPEVFYDSDNRVMWSPDGLGTDDRAGIWCIVSLLEEGYRPYIILCNEEEKGGIGARNFLKKFPKSPKKLRYLIEIDRQGYNEAVFYNCGNKEFKKFITSFGFKEDVGTFSDISIISPQWDIASCNVSAGYLYEHSVAEHCYLTCLEDTRDKLIEILVYEMENPDNERYNYQQISGYSTWWSSHMGSKNICEGCLNQDPEYCINHCPQGALDDYDF